MCRCIHVMGIQLHIICIRLHTSGAAPPATPTDMNKKQACAMLLHMLHVEGTYDPPDDNSVYWTPGDPLPVA